MSEKPKNNLVFSENSTQVLGRIFFLLVFLLAINMVKASSKVDTVYFQNGDRITGEVKSMGDNLLHLSTDDARNISIEWNKIDSIFVLNPLRLTLMNGEIRYGRIYPSGKVSECILHESNGRTENVLLWNIVELIPLEKKFINRVSGTISSGFSYVKASDVAQLDFAANFQYKGEKIVFEANYSVILTSDISGTTQRQNGGASLYRVLPKNWSIQGRILAESNSYFELDLRSTAGLGANYYLIRNNKQSLSLGSGFVINREFSGELTQDNFEGILMTNYKLYLFDSPEVSLNFAGHLIPGLSQFGRIRSEIDSNLKWEIFKDFYLKWTFYNSFDNKPLSGVDINRDWGITLGLEYKL